MPHFSFFDLRAANCKYIENSPSKLKFRNTCFSVRKNPLGTVAHNCHGKTKNLTAKPKTSLQKQNTSQQNQKPYGKNKIPLDKTKNLTAKPKTSRQNQILHSKSQISHGKSKYPRQNQSYFVFAVKYLVLPWDFWFCREVFCHSMSTNDIDTTLSTPFLIYFLIYFMFSN